MASLSKVYFFFEKKGVSLKNRTKLKLFIESVFKKEKTELKSLNYVFCSDQQILEINRQFLRHAFRKRSG
jgi:ssRNA-specific RNase YbeY (16S rRNA maturation enzyme)